MAANPNNPNPWDIQPTLGQARNMQTAYKDPDIRQQYHDQLQQELAIRQKRQWSLNDSQSSQTPQKMGGIKKSKKIIKRFAKSRKRKLKR